MKCEHEGYSWRVSNTPNTAHFQNETEQKNSDIPRSQGISKSIY